MSWVEGTFNDHRRTRVLLPSMNLHVSYSVCVCIPLHFRKRFVLEEMHSSTLIQAIILLLCSIPDVFVFFRLAAIEIFRLWILPVTATSAQRIDLQHPSDLLRQCQILKPSSYHTSPSQSLPPPQSPPASRANSVARSSPVHPLLLQYSWPVSD
jgi:hypothetical protein